VEATLRGHPSGVRSVAFSADGAWLLSGGDDGQALVHPVGFDTLVNAVSALPGRKTLTHEERRLYVPAFPTSGEANQPAVK
jgi:WD40 repeat protein